MLVVGFVLLCGCGNKGDLYLPDKNEVDKALASIEDKQ